MAQVGLPLTGAGDATASVATDQIGGAHYQRMKLHDGEDGSTLPIRALGTTPGSTDGGMVVRPIGSTAFNQAVVGAVGITSGSSQVGITSGSSEVALTSVGSTRLVGRVTVENPTTAVDLASGGSTKLVGQVDANLTSVGSTRLVGRVDVNNPTTAVTVSSGVVLGAGSSANIIGSVVNASGSTGAILGAMVLASGSTAFIAAAVAVSSGVVLGAGSSANTLGNVAQGPGSSANAWFQQSVPYSSGSFTRTSVATSVDVSVIAANANRKGLIIGSLSTAQICALGLSTAAVTTALANVSLFLQPNSQLIFGFPGGLPLYTGAIRGINISSTAIGGGVSVNEIT